VDVPGVRFRRAGPADASALLTLARAAFAVYQPRIGREPAPMAADYVRAVAQDDVWVADDGGALLGMLVLRRGEEDLLLDTVAVLPTAQGRGIGRALLRLAERRAAELGLAAPVNAVLARLVAEVMERPDRRAWFRERPDRLLAELAQPAPAERP